MKRALQFWNQFWFDSVSLYPLACMRILLCGNMFYIYLVRLIYNIDFYQEGSVIPRALALDMIPQFVRPVFAWFFWPDSMAYLVHVVFVVLLFLLTIGLAPRFLFLLTWILHMGFIQRNYAVLFGADPISAVFLFYLSFTQCSKVLSVKSLLFKKKKNLGAGMTSVSGEMSTGLLTPVFFRLIQIQIAVIYAYTGLEKLKGASWWDGTALWSVFANQQMVIFDMSFMRNFPLVISVITFMTVLWEIYWPVMISIRKLRYWWLVMGFLFHVGIGYLMALWGFSLVMLSTYFLFLEPRHIKNILKKLSA